MHVQYMYSFSPSPAAYAITRPSLSPLFLILPFTPLSLSLSLSLSDTSLSSSFIHFFPPTSLLSRLCAYARMCVPFLGFSSAFLFYFFSSFCLSPSSLPSSFLPLSLATSSFLMYAAQSLPEYSYDICIQQLFINKVSYSLLLEIFQFSLVLGDKLKLFL